MTNLTGRPGDANCPRCGSGMVYNGSRVQCLACPFREGIVSHSDRIIRIRREQGLEVPSMMRKSRPGKSKRKAAKATSALMETSLFGPVVRPSAVTPLPRREAHHDSESGQRGPAVVIPLPTRCPDCDRLYIVDKGATVCPRCGTVDSTREAIRMISKAFPGTEISPA